MLIHIPNVLSKDEVAHCRRVLESSPWIDGKATAGDHAARAKENLQIGENTRESRELGELILKKLAFNPAFNSAAVPFRVLPPMFNRYDVGMSFGAHVDGAIRAIPGAGGMRMRADVSSTLFLTEPEDYDGGELVVEDVYGPHSVKLPAGDMVVYPSTSLHRVETVTRGSRWSSFFWTQSMIRDDGMRATLYDLDVAIMEVRAALGDDSRAALGLVNHYHNLIRRWAEL